MLLVFVDDATCAPLELRFVPTESTFSSVESAGRYVDRSGKPVAAYSDPPLPGFTHGLDADGRAFDMDELAVVDGSVLTTRLGVDPQLSLMSIATRLTGRMRDKPLR